MDLGGFGQRVWAWDAGDTTTVKTQLTLNIEQKII